MNILYLLVGVSLLAALFFLGLFIWAVKSGQYEDTYSPSVRILFEDDEENMNNAEGEDAEKEEIKKDNFINKDSEK